MAGGRESYEKLRAHLREAAVLSSCGSLLSWDQETHMPATGAALRAEQHSLLAGLIHARATAPEIPEWIEAASHMDEARDEDSPVAAELREMRRDYERMTKLPAALVQETASTTSLARQAWADARAKKSFSLFEPWLERVVALARRQAEALGYTCEPYDALLDLYEPGETAESVARAFEPLRAAIVPLLERILGTGREVERDLLHRRYPADAQDAFAREAAAAIGFDFGRGRIDRTVHPFCSAIGPGDTRLTNRYDENFFGDGFFGLLHEAGHGIYEQNLPDEHFGSPLGEAASVAIHESQSRMWENLVGRGRAFWRHFLPRAREHFPQALADVSLEAFFRAVNDVRPTFIRVEADEVTYNLHVFLRFEIERALLKGDLAARDVPGTWNEITTRDLKITPGDDAEGCLQDIHWSCGSFGYFPTYTLGNLYAAQIYRQARRDVGGLEEGFARGEFRPLFEWLRRHVFAHGRRFPPRRLAERICGEPRSEQALVEHLQNRAAEVYGV